jgi:hypothetical protein
LNTCHNLSLVGTQNPAAQFSRSAGRKTMSIYATLWKLKFPKEGDECVACDWIEVAAQGVPPHIGSPTPSLGYEDGDPYADFLPPPVETNRYGDAPFMRAVVFVAEYSIKGTNRNGQEYVSPLLVSYIIHNYWINYRMNIVDKRHASSYH